MTGTGTTRRTQGTKQGNPSPLSGGVWTGSDHDGTERFEGGVSRALGQSQAAYGVPGSTVAGAGPLYAGSTADVTETRSLYALSYGFTIVAPGIVSNLLPALSARVNDDRSARRSQAFTTGPNLHGYDVSGVQIAYRDEEYDAISLALYSVDSNGHPDTEIAALTYPVAEAAEQSQTFALPAGTTPRSRHDLRPGCESRRLRHGRGPGRLHLRRRGCGDGCRLERRRRLRLRERGQLGGRHGQQGAAHPGPRHPEDRPPRQAHRPGRHRHGPLPDRPVLDGPGDGRRL